MEKIHAVELRGINKCYSGSEKKANNNISLFIRSGEILCIAGENGAGKTTLMKILNGIEIPDEGEIFINGSAVAINSPLVARKLGIGMVHQHFMLFPEYTVAENIVMGMEPRRCGIFFDGKKAKTEAAKIITSHHFSIDPDKPVKSLSIGEMQQVEICRLLYRNVNIIILDEPTSVLTEHETESLFKTLKTLAAQGKSIFLITHKLHEIKSISDRVAVLRNGELVGTNNTGKIDEYAISKMMMGSNFIDIPKTLGRCASVKNKNDPVIIFDSVTVKRRGQERPLLDEISFSVNPGEIVGFAGVGGNGLGVLEAVLGGFLHPVEGKIIHKGKDISRLKIRSLRKRRLAYIPADRQRVGSAVNATIEENLIIDRRKNFSRMGFLDKKSIHNFSEELFARYSIVNSGGANPVSSLSGGNLQKLILAREMDQFRDYFVFSEPTWGLDIASSGFIHEEIIKLRNRSAAIILISTNLDEILLLAGRIMVMYRGRIAAEFDNSDKTAAASVKEKVGECMQGLLP